MSAQRFDLSPSATQANSGQGAPQKLDTATMLFVALNITAETSATLTVWLQGSDDGGTTWYDLVADHVLAHTGAAAGGSPLTDERDIANGVTTTGKHSAVYKHMPTDRIRVAWDLTGTDATFVVKAVAK